MKLTTRGFTLVELMIVIAIIGILAATLFPSLTSYLARGRDTARTSGMKEIVTATASFLLDANRFPNPVANAAAGAAMCASATSLSGYIQKFPVDPVAGRTNNCGTALMFGYGTGTDTNGTNTFTVSAVLEGANAGNTGGFVRAYQGSALTAATMTAIDTALVKGAGSGYVVRN